MKTSSSNIFLLSPEIHEILGPTMGDVRHTYIVKASPAQAFEYLRDISHLPDQLSEYFDVELKTPGQEQLEQGHEYQWLMTRFGLSQQVKISVDECIRNERLSYRQLEGIFRVWRHVIQISAHNEDLSRITESVHYVLPFGLIGHVVDDLYWNSDLKGILESRSEVIREYFD